MELARTFEWGINRHEAVGKLEGWRPVDAPAWFDHGGSIIVVHDSMEQLHPEDTSLEAEMKASGAGLAVRLQGAIEADDTLAIREWGKVLGEDSASFVMTDKRELAVPTGPIPAMPEVLERAMKDLIIPAQKRTVKERRDNPFTRWGGEPLQARLEAAKQWMRIGYAEAASMYGTIAPQRRLQLFNDIRAAVDRIRSSKLPMDGDRLMVRIDTDAKTAQMDYKANLKWSVSDRQQEWLRDDIFELLFG